MTTIVRMVLPAAGFALGETYDRIPSAEFDVVRVADTSTNQAVPLLWATAEAGEPFESLPEAVRDDPSVRDVTIVAEFDSEYLLKLSWETPLQSLFATLREENATTLDAGTTSGNWQFRVLFPDHDSVSTVYQQCQDLDINVDVTRVTQLSAPLHQSSLGLTECQHQTLVGAYREGYYDIPRQANLQKLTDSFDVSHQALSERLRRGHGKLIEHVMAMEHSA